MVTIFLPPTVIALGDLGGELACGGKCPGPTLWLLSLMPSSSGPGSSRG
jgi:hypothetical protein